MPRHARPILLPAFTAQASPQVHYAQLAQHHHSSSPSYGLLEPTSSPVESLSGSPTCTSSPSARMSGARRGTSLSLSPTAAQASRRHLRKSAAVTGGFGRSMGRVVPAWSEVEAGFDELRDIGFGFGANIGSLGDKLSQTVPGVRGSVGELALPLRTILASHCGRPH